MREFSNMKLFHISRSPGYHREMQAERHERVGAEMPAPPPGEEILLQCSICSKKFVFKLMTPKVYAAAQRRLRGIWIRRLVVFMAVVGIGVVLGNFSGVVGIVGIVLGVVAAWVAVFCVIMAVTLRSQQYVLVGTDGSSQPDLARNLYHAVRLS